jgi:hypothetical protein
MVTIRLTLYIDQAFAPDTNSKHSFNGALIHRTVRVRTHTRCTCGTEYPVPPVLRSSRVLQNSGICVDVSGGLLSAQYTRVDRV